MSEENGVERRIAQEARLVKLETQSDRTVSDAESEKATRRRSGIDIQANFDKIEVRLLRIEEKLNALQNKMYWFSGAMAAFVFVIHWVFK